MQFRRDLVEVMERCGQVPWQTLKETVSMIEQSNQTKDELVKTKDANVKLTSEFEEFKENYPSIERVVFHE